VVRAKSKCCKDKPRCKKCPIALKRLADAGYYRPGQTLRRTAREARHGGGQDRPGRR